MYKVKTDYNLQLDYLPGYAAFLLSDYLDEFIQALIRNSYELDIPILKYFRSMKKEDMIKLSIDSNTKLLSALKNNTHYEYIVESQQNWKQNLLPIISRDQVVVEDITLVNYTRRKTFREMLHLYTSDPEKIILIMDEIDRFILSVDSILFKTYIAIQHEKLEEANNALQKRERELLEAQEIGSIGSFEWDLTGNQQSSFTPEVYKIFEFTQTSNLEAFMNDVYPEDRLKLKTAIEKAMVDGTYECEYRYNRNDKFKILFSKGKVFYENGKPIKMVGTVTDFTEKANLITKLKESEELSKQAQALTKTGNWKWDIHENSIEWSDEMYRIYGLEPQCEKISFERFLSFIHEEDRNRRVIEITEGLKTGKLSDYVMKIVGDDGIEKILKGKGEVKVDKNGHPTGMMGTCQDITNEYKLTSELKRKNKELLRKNRDLESFNFIASHDLQEPLRKIQLYCDRIITEEPGKITGDSLNYFNKILQASGRMQTMIEDFLTFYQFLKTEKKAELLDMNEIVTVVCNELCEAITEKNASIEFKDLQELSGTKILITELFRQLISNALKFSMPGRIPAIVIKSNEKRIDGKTYIVIEVCDNGIGFDQKYENRIFELFQKLHNKDEFRGSGIGLSLCKKIAEDHQGWITVQSEKDKGTAFKIHLLKK